VPFTVTSQLSWQLASVGIGSAVMLTDLRDRRVPNGLTLAAAGFGLAYWSTLARLPGLKFSILGLLCGLAIGMVPYALRIWGGGDAKLLAAVGTWIGPSELTRSLWAIGMLGGLLSLAYGLPLLLAGHGTHRARKQTVPYSLAIMGGMLCAHLPWSLP
jgi:Flp pilus assembly protein protease CpaA